MLNTIFSRRSIRKYKNDPIPKDVIETLLKAGMAAPSARNSKCCRFIVLTQREMLEKVSELRPAWKPLSNAPLGIIVIADVKDYPASIEHSVNDISACTENILLAAQELGLGACWLGCAPKLPSDNVRNMFNLDEHLVPGALISVGYPDETRPQHTEFDMSRVIGYY